jgi:predicted deacetylase
MSWLAPIRRALDAAARPVEILIRDDDAGWDDARLLALLDLVGERELPIDLAVIPRALSPGLAARLRRRAERSAAPLGFHQHGLAHRNHELEGRRSEFGASRSAAAQRADIAEGARLLAERLGPGVDPIFTPPWNRCSADTGRSLAALGFRALSRESRAPTLGIDGLAEIPVSVDWFAHRKGVRLARSELGDLLGAACEADEPLGLMLHHAVMGHDERGALAELLDLLAGHPRALARPMAALIAAGPAQPAWALASASKFS